MVWEPKEAGKCVVLSDAAGIELSVRRVGGFKTFEIEYS